MLTPPNIERRSDMREVVNSLSILTAAINTLSTLVNVHIATDIQYRKLIDEHEIKIKGNGSPSYDAKIESLNMRMKMVFSIGAAIWGLASVALGWVIVKIFNDYAVLLTMIPH